MFDFVQLRGHIHSMLPCFANRYIVVNIGLASAIHKVIHRPFRVLRGIPHEFFQNTIHYSHLHGKITNIY